MTTNINLVNHLEQLFLWGIPKQNSLIIGSAVMALHGMRKNYDLDVLVSIPTFMALRWERGLDLRYGKHSGLFKYISKDGLLEVYAQSQFDCFYGSCILTKAILQKAEIINGYRFLPLPSLLKFKQWRMRDYDVKDIQLIKNYLNTYKL